MSDSDDRLGRLLRAPLAPVADAGFSAQVMARIAVPPKHSWWLDEAVLFAAAGLVPAFVASTELPGRIANLGYDLATSLPVATAALVLTLTLAFVRATAD